MLHLLVLPVGDTQGQLLWSTPLLLGVPFQVAQELQQLHTAMAQELFSWTPGLARRVDANAQRGSPERQATLAGCWAAAAGRAYNDNLVPLVWDLLRCFQAAPPAANAAAQQYQASQEHQQDPQDEQHQEEAQWAASVHNVVAFLQSPGLPMPGTLQWLAAGLQIPVLAQQPVPRSCNISASCTTPTNQSTRPASPLYLPAPSSGAESTAGICQAHSLPAASPAPPPPTDALPARHAAVNNNRKVVAAVLRGTFHSNAEEQQFLRYLKRQTQPLDRNMGYVQLIMLGCAALKGPPLYSAFAVVNWLAHLYLQLQLLGRRRQLCDRQRVVKWKLWWHIAHVAGYALFPQFPVAKLVEVWGGQGFWVLVLWVSLFGNAIDQVRGCWLPCFAACWDGACLPQR